jgi:hypothetical protein
MIHEITVSRKFNEIGRIFVEADDNQSALNLAKELIDEDEDNATWGDEEYRSDDEAEVVRAESLDDNPYILNITIGNRPAIPVLRENGSYILE